jgi:hypothetical protein
MDVLSPRGARHPGQTLLAAISQERKEYKESP